MPGNFDVLNTRALYESSNQWGIPDLPRSNWEPERLLAYNDRHGTANPAPNSGVHFFLDDYRFETLWTKPTRPLTRLQRVGIAMTPDFSMWANMPRVMQIWQVYRARWCGAWMVQHGIKIIPTVGWADQASFEFCFEGIAPGSTVAISAVGVHRNKDAHLNFALGVSEMMERVQPDKVLVYGKLPAIVDYDEQLFRFYPTRWR
jgi:hypothetical protein